MIDLAEWNLQQPVALPAAWVQTAELNAKGFRSPFLQCGEGGSLVFWTPAYGTPLPPARDPATELRETRPDGSAYVWRYREADALLQAEAAVQHLPPRGEVVISQIEDQTQTAAGNEPAPLLQLIYRVEDLPSPAAGPYRGALVARVRERPGESGKDVALLIPVSLDKRFNYDIKVSRSGLLSLRAYSREAHTGDLNLQLDDTWSTRHLYFKAGAQLVNAQARGEGGARVVFYRLASMHQPNNR